MHGSNKNCIFGSDKFSLPALFLHIGGASSFLPLVCIFLFYQILELKCFPLGFVCLFPLPLGICTVALFG